MTGLPLRGALQDEELLIIEDGGVLVEDNVIYATGRFTDLMSQAKTLNAELVTLTGDVVCLPGFIDTHTHICFGGSRANDYAMRNAGKSYLEIAKAGGGIWDTVTQTRKASKEQLTTGIVARANRHLRHGVTTIEVKSGYGLSVDEELKMLRAIKTADKNIPASLIPTCLAAHMFPKDYNGTAEEYLSEIATSLFPKLKEEQLTNRVDAFIEESAFSQEVIRPYFEKAVSMGFDITVHADQFSTGGSEIAVEIGAISADHLEASTEKEINLLASSNVIATALPGASMGLGCNYTPGRKILDAGGTLAIASDWNPGSAPMGNLLMQATVFGTFEKLTNLEILAGITTRAAAALKLTDRGSLEVGHLADLTIFPTHDYKEILYQQGMLIPSMVWKEGDLVFNGQKA